MAEYHPKPDALDVVIEAQLEAHDLTRLARKRLDAIRAVCRNLVAGERMRAADLARDLVERIESDEVG